MKVGLIAPSPVPFVIGGAERLVAGLLEALNERSQHDAELIKLPTAEGTLPEVMASYRRFSTLDLTHFDAVVTCKYPAWMISHPRHAVYMMHPLRGLYDTYHVFGQPLRCRHEEPVLRRLQSLLERHPERAVLGEVFGAFDEARAALGDEHPAFVFPGPLARQLVHWLDGVALAPGAVVHHAAIARTVARRPGYFPRGVPVTALHPPTNLAGLGSGPFEYLFTASRLDQPKRLDLLIEAMAHVRGDMRLRIAGTGPEGERLKALAAPDPRIELVGYVSSAELVAHYRHALAVPFVPLDEDYGYITLEAMHCGKPVVTTTDAGGPTELVEHGRSGYVVPPEPQAIAEALQRLVEDRDLAQALGREGQQRAECVTWDAVIAGLLAPPRRASSGEPWRRRSDRDKVVVASPMVVHPVRAGGQLRSAALYGGLARHFDVEIVSLGSEDDVPRIAFDAATVREVVVPRSREHAEQERKLSASLGWLPITDVGAARFISSSPGYLRALKTAATDAAAMILSHPYLLPAVEMAAPALPRVYDAHNVEGLLKAEVLPASAIGRTVLTWIEEVETRAVRSSALTSACSAADVEELTRRYGLSMHEAVVIPNGVDPERIAFTGVEARARARRWLIDRLGKDRRLSPDTDIALFIGSWHTPNLEAAALLMELAPSLPDVLFIMAGSHMAYYRNIRLPTNMLPVGVVGNAVHRALLRSSSVALNPMSSGSGTNLKMLEYFAAGIPVVSTEFGARGLGARPEEHYVAATPEAFGAGIRCALKAPGAMVVSARALVQEHYDWATIATAYASAIKGVLHKDAQVEAE